VTLSGSNRSPGSDPSNTPVVADEVTAGVCSRSDLGTTSDVMRSSTTGRPLEVGPRGATTDVTSIGPRHASGAIGSDIRVRTRVHFDDADRSVSPEVLLAVQD